MFYQTLILVTVLIKLNNSVTITIESHLTFPSIVPNNHNLNSFIRIHKTKKEVLHCPDDFIFDNKELKCVFNGAKDDNIKVPTVRCPENYAGLLPNRKNCQTFIDCCLTIAVTVGSFFRTLMQGNSLKVGTANKRKGTCGIGKARPIGNDLPKLPPLSGGGVL
ncbi:hypothetical protein RN001_001832 [Aquatica leii]|uniref:Uncharacterized protein n=1 Tax=Aquatica leii TaxID=1421715 RepID=A0AAN7PP32_9COLE|nr:hypothetical protein RN001_001832 [Aquatica leii]